MPNSRALSADMTTMAAAPSFKGLELPAVTVPPFKKAGSSVDRRSSEVSRRGPSSVVMSLPLARDRHDFFRECAVINGSNGTLMAM